MPSITALIHTNNDALRLGRILETLYPCDQIAIVDHGSQDATVEIARDYGARVFQVRTTVSTEHLVPSDLAGWILCLDPREALTEGLAASLFEWKTEAVTAPAFSVYLREETSEGWIQNPVAQTRLVPADCKHWSQSLPSSDRSAVALEGELLRFALP